MYSNKCLFHLINRSSLSHKSIKYHKSLFNNILRSVDDYKFLFIILGDTNIQMYFHECCVNGNLKAAKWLYYNDQALKRNYLKDHAPDGDVDVDIQYVITHKPDGSPGGIDIHMDEESAFIASCANGRLKVAKWLLLLDFPNISIHADRGAAFRYSCANGHLKVAKWLYRICNDPNDRTLKFYRDNYAYAIQPLLTDMDDTRFKYEYAFEHSYKNGHSKVTNWLRTIDPLIKN